MYRRIGKKQLGKNKEVGLQDSMKPCKMHVQKNGKCYYIKNEILHPSLHGDGLSLKDRENVYKGDGFKIFFMMWCFYFRILHVLFKHFTEFYSLLTLKVLTGF